MIRASLLCSILLAVSLTASADTIVSRTGSSNACCFNFLSYASWTQTTTYSGVSIAAVLSSSGGTATGTAYLTTQVGTGTTVAQQVATAPISISNTAPSLITVLSGLKLVPNTYFLVINPSTSALVWNGSSPATVTAAAGVTVNNDFANFGAVAAYPPASTFGANKGSTLLYTVTGTLGLGSSSTPATGAPALSGWAMLLTAGLLCGSGLWLVRKYGQA
jgi:hypothetical protein